MEEAERGASPGFLESFFIEEWIRPTNSHMATGYLKGIKVVGQKCHNI